MAGERAVDTYYSDVKNMTLLTAELEKRLFASYRTCGNCRRTYTEDALQTRCPACDKPRDLRSRERLVEGALRFVVKMAREYARRAKGERHGEELLLALISAGNLGLLVAVDRFALEKGTRFLTYAAWWVREKILEELDNMGVVRVPAYQQKAQRARWKQSGGDMEPPHVTLTTLDDVDRSASDTSTEKSLLDKHGASTVQRVLAMSGIPIRHQYIVSLHLGLREDPKTLKQIAMRVGYTPERARAARKDALDSLRRYLENELGDGLTDLLE